MSNHGEIEEDCFHLGVKAILHHPEGKWLLLQRRRSNGEIYWDLPGGRVQKGESSLEALQRELREEIGLQEPIELRPLSLHLTPIRVQVEELDVGLIFFLYTASFSSDFSPILSQEHQSYIWESPQKALELLQSKWTPQLFSDVGDRLDFALP
jgi:8-oxo-dGTP diphosphatase